MKLLLPIGISLGLLVGCSAPSSGRSPEASGMLADSPQETATSSTARSEWVEPAGDPELVEFLRWVASWRELSGPAAVARCVERYPELALRAAERLPLDVEWLREVRAALDSGIGARWKLAQALVIELEQPAGGDPAGALAASIAAGDPALVERVLASSAHTRIAPREREEARALAARAWSQRGRAERALALVEDGTSVDELVEASVALATLGDLEAALTKARAAAELRVGRPQAVLGALLAGAGASAEARAQLERAVASGLGPVAARAQSDLGLLELERGDAQRARSELATSRRLLEELGDAAGLARSLLGEAGIRAARGETEAARELRQRAGELVRAHGLLVLVDPERDAPALPVPVQPPQPRNSDTRW
jgi:tetratricopeptide (TPR) repeat protein